MRSRSTTGPRFAVVRFVFAAFLVMTALQARSAAAQAPDRVDVVALMVEFQPDTTRFTTGNGTFDGPLFPDVEAPTIDPLPHGADYFGAHLRFLENYVRRVSDGRTEVRTHLLPSVVQVSQTMGAYSPTGLKANEDAELSKLSALVVEAWTLAEQSGVSLPAGLDPATTAFVIFHAGVGRDIELVGTTLDKTPEDLPSLFFGPDALRRLGADNVTVDGMVVGSTMILPRTESRLGESPLTSEPFLIELSINGLLAASFFNYLGVPDLFNTETGDTAIGPFGVMDALGIFAYSGLFPPEPSAWTKQFLGWQDPVSAASEGLVSLRASGHEGVNDAARIAISDAEYFLVENRHRDPDGDGVRLQVWTHEGEKTVVFPNGDPEFNDQTVEGFPGGVVLDVDDYDFALPGGLDENDNALLGGILIWHVDENRLNDRLESNSVNADRSARAIDLEEADGAQDIGFNSASGLFGPRFDLGTPFDFWYEGNPVTVRTSTGQDIRLYENRFGPDTDPSNASNSGADSGIELTDFSVPGPVMTFRVGAASAPGVSLASEWQADTDPGYEADDRGIVFPNTESPGFWTWVEDAGRDDEAELTWIPLEGERMSLSTIPVQPAWTPEGVVVVDEAGFSRYRVAVGTLEHARISDPFSSSQLEDWSPRIAWSDVAGEHRFHVGVRRNDTPVLMSTVLRSDGTFESHEQITPAPVLDVLVPGRTQAQLLVITASGVLDEQMTLLVQADLSGVPPGTRFDGAFLDDGWVLAWTGNGHVNILDDSGEHVSWPLVASGCAESNATFAHVDTDGEPDILVACGARVWAFHRTGAVLTGFPMTFRSDVVSTPLLARNAENQPLVVLTRADGTVEIRNAINGSFHLLAAGKTLAAAPWMADGAVGTLSGAGTIRIWSIDTVQGRNLIGADELLVRGEGAPSFENGERLLIAEETYNWPNPIESGATNIRFAVREASTVSFDIVDMAGGLVHSVDDIVAPAGIPMDIPWSTNAGSGVYLVRVKAVSNGGSSDTRLIRMAIIR